jgi:RNA polymerase sigma-70 factor (ECF subfamily)
MQSYPTALESKALLGLNDDSANSTVAAAVLSERTDRQLVDIVLAGDETAFEQIFDRHKHMVAKLAGRYFRQPAEAEDVLQITFAKVFTELERFRGEHEFSLAGWIRRIAVNACLDALRSRKRKPESFCCELSDSEAAEMARVSSAGSGENEITDRDLIEKLLSHLEPEDRVVLQLLHSEDMPIADIATALGWSSSKVKIRAWRARRALRKVIRQYL